MCTRNSWKILIYTKLIFSQYNIFINLNISFCILFSDLFSISAKEVNKIRNIYNRSSLYCSSPCFRILLCTHYGPMQSFSTYFLIWSTYDLTWSKSCLNVKTFWLYNKKLIRLFDYKLVGIDWNRYKYAS